jgi:hypothetical protein
MHVVDLLILVPQLRDDLIKQLADIVFLAALALVAFDDNFPVAHVPLFRVRA